MTRPTPRPSWTIWLAVSLTVLLCSAGARADEPWLTFSGEVARGEIYRHQLEEDLWFMLKPDPQGWGWHIWIGDPSAPNDDYAAVVTPPYRGVNHLQIFGWHFRNADNSSPNTAGPKNVNAPQELRSFKFVLNSKDSDDAAAALDRLLWGPVESEDVARHLQTWRRELAKGHGELKITDMTLSDLAPGETARFDHMAFTVTLWR